jgi:hypothetical protein
MNYRLWAAVGALVLLAGCVQAPKKQAFNREQATALKTLAIVQPPNQEQVDVIIVAHPGMSFGLVGGLIAAADMQAKTSRLSTAIDPKELRLQEQFSQKLKERLATIGYQSQTLTMPKDTKAEQVLPMARQQSSADALVQVELVGRYIAAGPSSDYFPFVQAKVVAQDMRTGTTLYEDTFTYGYANGNQQTVHFASSADHRYADMDALVANPAKARAGLVAGLDSVVDQIIADLRRN